ncbi:MAG: DUF58 domain-containing protein [Defluviitaleaceae bacterium]|nr:DUF58 domain-containing protein [Defluviitaleaceae bacterium]
MPLIFFLAVITIGYLIQEWSKKNALNGVEFQYKPSRLLVAPEEQFQITTTITNRSLRFIPFVRLKEILPETITIHVPGVVVSTDRINRHAWYTSMIYLMPRKSLVREIPVSIPNRGWYTFSGAELQGGDFLGTGENYKKVDSFNEIVIYPKVAENAYIDRVVGGFLGDISVRRFIIEDPILTAGFREYTGREPMKAISWSQSLRAGRMMVKSYDYTTEISAGVVLNVDRNATGDTKYDIQLIEHCLSIAHTVCRALEQKRIKYDFFSNIVTFGSHGSWDYISEGLGASHFQTILEGLGRASGTSSELFHTLVNRVFSKQMDDKAIIFIVPGSAEEAKIIIDGRDEGRAVIISAETSVNKVVNYE